MVNLISPVLCPGLKAPSGVASLSFDEVTTGRFVEGGAVFDIQSNEPPVRKDIDDLRAHPRRRMKPRTVVSDEQAENAKPRLR